MYIYIQNIFVKYISLSLKLLSVIFISYFIFLVAYSHLQRVPIKDPTKLWLQNIVLNLNNKVLQHM